MEPAKKAVGYLIPFIETEQARAEAAGEDAGSQCHAREGG